MSKDDENKKKPGQPTKYDPKTFPKLVEKHAEDGLCEYQIAQQLGVCRDTFVEYKKLYPELVDALKRGKAKDIGHTENALSKKARGFTYKETHTTTVKIKDKNGEEIVTTTVKVVDKEVAPDTGAIEFKLTNALPAEYKRRTDIRVREPKDDVEPDIDFSKLSDEAKREIRDAGIS